MSPLNERDVERVQNNPALLGMPFSRARFLLVELSSHGSLGSNHLNRERLLYTLFNLEMYAMNRNSGKKRQKAALQAHVGCYLSEIRGLNYMQTLRRLCLLHYEKRYSLMYQQQVEEYEHDLHKVALNMISSALSAWIFGKILPKHHANRYGARRNKVLYGKGREVKAEAKRVKKEAAKALHEENEQRAARGEPPLQPDEFDPNAHRYETYPSNSLWRRLPQAHRAAVVGVASMRLESLAILFRAVKKEKPVLLAQQEEARKKELQRVAALSDEERKEEEAKKKTKQAEEAAKAERRAKRKNAGCNCLSRKGSNTSGRSYNNPMMNADDATSPIGDSLLSPAERGEAMDSDEEEEGYGLSAAMDEEVLDDMDAQGSHTATGMGDVGFDDDSDEDDNYVSEETKAAYREVFDAFASSPGAPLDQNAAAKLLEKHYGLVLVDSKLSPKQYVGRYWNDAKRPQMCSDSDTGFTFEDYILWEADNYSLNFGEKQPTEIVGTKAQAWADAHQGTAEDQRALLRNAADASIGEKSTSVSDDTDRIAVETSERVGKNENAGEEGRTVMLNPMMAVS